ncbi:hypothetical protein SDC9_164439 [bioreactor metagenome]|uniref:Uncharacterized protein n=1 Tax=bioreactor metagenome TaxID=1076179 RepID=A0A645FUB0_9ZZZZ
MIIQALGKFIDCFAQFLEIAEAFPFVTRIILVIGKLFGDIHHGIDRSADALRQSIGEYERHCQSQQDKNVKGLFDALADRQGAQRSGQPDNGNDGPCLIIDGHSYIIQLLIGAFALPLPCSVGFPGKNFLNFFPSQMIFQIHRRDLRIIKHDPIGIDQSDPVFRESVNFIQFFFNKNPITAIRTVLEQCAHYLGLFNKQFAVQTPRVIP